MSTKAIINTRTNGFLISLGKKSNKKDNDVVLTSDIVGVQDTGVRSVNGAGLRQVIVHEDHLIETNLNTEYFDNHPCYQFEEYQEEHEPFEENDIIYDKNYFVKIPIAYWWRGMMPDTTDGITPRWTMLISDKPIIWNGKEFTAQAAVFKHYENGWMDQFYYGKYSGSNDGDVTGVDTPASKPNRYFKSISGNFWNNFWNLNEWNAACDVAGKGYHLSSIHEYSEVFGRIVIEKNTFNLNVSEYRNIIDLNRLAILNGCQIKHIDGNNCFLLWDEAGGSHHSLELSLLPNAHTWQVNYYTQSLFTDEDLLNDVFLAKTVTTNIVESFIPSVIKWFIPNYPVSNCIPHVIPSYAFSFNFYFPPNGTQSTLDQALDGRLAKW